MPDPTKHKTGDVVTLNSGGPRMSVITSTRNTETQEEETHCVWFSGSDLQGWHGPAGAKFDARCLELIEVDPAADVSTPEQEH